VAPHSEGREFPHLSDRGRTIVEKALFDCLSRPVFFEHAVDLVQRRVAEKIQSGERTQEEIRRLIQAEVRVLSQEMEIRFMRTGQLSFGNAND
jgi:hypothetical protein